MGERARTLAIPDAAERIARLIAEVAGPEARRSGGKASTCDRGAHPAPGGPVDRGGRSGDRSRNTCPCAWPRPKATSPRKSSPSPSRPFAPSPSRRRHSGAGASRSPPRRSTLRFRSATRAARRRDSSSASPRRRPSRSSCPRRRRTRSRRSPISPARPSGSARPARRARWRCSRCSPREGIGVHQVTIQSFGERALVGALESGAIEAAMVQDPWASRLLDEGKVVALADLRTAAEAATLARRTDGACRALRLRRYQARTGGADPTGARAAPGTRPDSRGHPGRARGRAARRRGRHSGRLRPPPARRPRRLSARRPGE